MEREYVMAKLKDPLSEARTKNAKYAGMLARWGDMTGNIPPHDVNRSEWLMKRFTEYVEELKQERKSDSNSKETKKRTKTKKASPKKKSTGTKGSKTKPKS
jgi:hypothetical protein